MSRNPVGISAISVAQLWFAFLWIAVPAWAGTGQLRVTVTDEAGIALEQVSVDLSVEEIVRTQVTDAAGQVLFTELPAGSYRLHLSSPGFRNLVVEGVLVKEDRTTAQVVELGPAETEELVVVTGKRQVLSKEFLQRIPVGRSYQTAVQTESYEHPGFGPLVFGDEDRLSTFAIDVDTASFALCRAKLEDGALPDPAAVRVEEFVNAFRYDWSPPPGADPLALRMEAAPDPVRDGRVLLSVALQGKPAAPVDRPVRLTFLVDVSGSMAEPDKLPLVQHALHRLVDGLGLEDRVAIATYAGVTGIALAPSWTVRKGPIHAAIDRLSGGGSTAMGAGIELAYGMAEEMYVENAENRVIILTDGDANVGVTSVEQLLGLVNRWAGDGITLSVVGFGQGNYKDALLERMADRGDGNYHYVDSEREADRVFGRDLTSNLVTLARDVKVQVEFPAEAVVAWRQIGYENRAVADEDFRDDTVDGGEVGVGHQVTALYELVLKDEPRGDLARVSARAEPPGREGGGAIEFGTTFDVRQIRPAFDAASQDLRWAAAVATFAEKLRGSPHLPGELSWDEVLALVDRALDPSDAEQVALRELVARARKLGTSR